VDSAALSSCTNTREHNEHEQGWNSQHRPGRHQRVMALAWVVQTRERMVPRHIDDCTSVWVLFTTQQQCPHS